MEGEWTQIKKERKEDNYKGREINRELEKQIKTDTEKERMIEGENEKWTRYLFVSFRQLLELCSIETIYLPTYRASLDKQLRE